MAAYNSPATLTTPGGTVTFNPASPTGTYYFHDPTQCSGLDMAPIRAPVDDKPTDDGGILHRFWFGARHVTLSGRYVFPDFATRQTMEDNLAAALTSIMRADGTYSWTPPGFTLHSITVRCDVPLADAGGWSKTYLFGLVSASSSITVA